MQLAGPIMPAGDENGIPSSTAKEPPRPSIIPSMYIGTSHVMLARTYILYTVTLLLQKSSRLDARRRNERRKRIRRYNVWRHKIYLVNT